MLHPHRRGSMAVLLLLLTVSRGDAQTSSTDKLLGPARDLNAPVEMNSINDDPSKRSVLIYYANETAPNEAEAANYQRILELLNGSSNPKIRKIAESIQGDLKKFHTIVDQELEVLSRNAGNENPDEGICIAIFTNRQAREGKFQLLFPGTSEPVEHPLVVPRFNLLAYSANPLSHPSMFQIALSAVSQQFNPDTHQFVLITKSHGTAIHALTPRVWLDVTDIPGDVLLARLEQDVARQPPVAVKPEDSGVIGSGKADTALDPLKSDAILDPFKTDVILDPFKTDVILDPFKTDVILSKDDQLDSLDEKRSLVGTTKAEYVLAITQASQSTGMHFPLLFIESCRSELDQVQLRNLAVSEAGVGRLYTSDLKGLQYTTLDYNKIFERVKSGTSLATAIHEELFARYTEQKATRKQAEHEHNRSTQE